MRNLLRRRENVRPMPCVTCRRIAQGMWVGFLHDTATCASNRMGMVR